MCIYFFSLQLPYTKSFPLYQKKKFHLLCCTHWSSFNLGPLLTPQSHHKYRDYEDNIYVNKSMVFLPVCAWVHAYICSLSTALLIFQICMFNLLGSTYWRGQKIIKAPQSWRPWGKRKWKMERNQTLLSGSLLEEGTGEQCPFRLQSLSLCPV